MTRDHEKNDERDDTASSGLHDPHLREALRHAPDADIAAPPSLSATILQRATAAVRASAPSSLQERQRSPARQAWWSNPWKVIRSGWDQLARPPVAAAFATVLVASTLTLLWRDGLMDRAFNRPTPAAASVAAAPEAVTSPAIAASSALEARVATPPAAAPAPLEKARPKPSAAATEPRPSPSPPRQAPTRSASLIEPPPSAEPPVKAPAIAAPAAASPATADAVAPAPRPDRASNGATATREATPAPQSLARAAAASPVRARQESLASDRLRLLPRQLQNQQARWSTQRDGTAPQTLDEATSAWLHALAQEATAADAQWELASAPAAFMPTGTEAQPANRGGSLVLLRDGIAQHRFQLGEDRITWEQGDFANGATRWMLTLPTPAMRRLLAALPALPAAPPASAASR